MKVKKELIESLVHEIDAVIDWVVTHESAEMKVIDGVRKKHRKSARNLIHYRSFRKHDLRPLQNKLRNLGSSRFARAEAHVMASLYNTRLILNSLIGKQKKATPKSGLSIKSGRKLLVQNTKDLLGFRSKGRRVRIMVTLPTAAADDPELVYEMVRNGMNCARINCAHDDPVIWMKIIRNIKIASRRTGRIVKITMDLAGPKIRTGEIQPGPKVRKYTPERDDSGKVLNPAIITFGSSELVNPAEVLPVDGEWLQQIKVGDELELSDTRGKNRKLKVFEKADNELMAYCFDTSYIGTGTIIRSDREYVGEAVVGEIPPVEQSILLHRGDILTVHRGSEFGQPAILNEEGHIIKNAHISCQAEEVFHGVKLGEKVLFDDGKISGKIVHVDSDSFDVKITRTKEFGSRLKAEKGINFPDSDLGISGLTLKDRKDLEFIVPNADVVNFSFVNSPKDVDELIESIRELNPSKDFGIILKIETKQAYDNLINILLAAMKVNNIGVMIARGDLAVETGWDHIGVVQKEILKICNAAHVPVIWATQVLESLAKKGIPSRSEITDATTSLKAECVMLNKGPYINEAISLLHKILSDMEKFNAKNESMLPQLEKI